MNSVYLNIFKRFFLLSALIFAVAGCGSSSSTANNHTGAIAAKLIWNSAESKTTAKTLYVAPAGVSIVKIQVLSGNVSLKSKDFTASDGIGQIDGIMAGSGYTVKIQGLASGTLTYERLVSNVTINAGEVTDLGSIKMFPITTASLPGSNYSPPQSVTLTNSEAVTIFYTTSTINGTDPTTSSNVYAAPITISGHIFLKFFAVYPGSISESVRTEEYSPI